jgi:osmotically-inducible protein OsmY
MLTVPTSKQDVRLRDAVIEQLEWDGEVEAGPIGVAAEDGVVTLTGFVESLSAKAAAELAAKRTFGVRAVANDLQVQPVHQRTDPQIAHDALAALRSRVNVPSDVTVTVSNGHLKLEGVVDRVHQKASAEDAVRHLRGVTGLTNDITVRRTPVAADDVKAKIEQALCRSAEIEARRIDVQVYGSTVTLRGNLHSWGARAEVERVAAAAPGVTLVLNEIAVTA